MNNPNRVPWKYEQLELSSLSVRSTLIKGTYVTPEEISRWSQIPYGKMLVVVHSVPRNPNQVVAKGISSARKFIQLMRDYYRSTVSYDVGSARIPLHFYLVDKEGNRRPKRSKNIVDLGEGGFEGLEQEVRAIARRIKAR